ncbi:hypothetical protein B0J13DRAFT_558743 [Dactylonectria estremocensis]|uniref:Zn(2)-C6 fungal-type domain-containing protein n=1 Tax=Dactylonectria estremocensis TaxID=1079267 RepID=A0A9P9EM46_9HYPO|nr:hypothetical protein B0J13DRAFT_558743 [Dactylonectria estremocensis]
MEGPPSEQTGVAKHVAQTSRASAAYPRKRAVVACQVCRARRTKCDQKKPSCSFCQKIGAVCVSAPHDLSTFDPASLAIIERLERLEKKLDASSFQPVQPLPSGAAEPHSGDASDNTPTDPAQLQALLPENLDGLLRWPVLRDIVAGLTPDPSLCGNAPSIREEPFLTISDELDAAVCNTWLDAFFNRVHVKNPIMDEGTTRRLVLRVCLEGAGWDAHSCLALLVCANGALVEPFPSPPIQHPEVVPPAAMALFTAAQKRLGPLLMSPGVVQAQCLFLSGVFLMSILRPFDAWRMFLQALATCQSFASFDWASDSKDNANATTKESVYWSCWKSEQEVRWELGVSRFGGVEPPQQFPSLPGGYDGQNLRAWYFYLSEISLWRLETEAKHEMLTLLENCSGSCLFDKLADLGDNSLQQLADWRVSLAPPVALAEHDATVVEDDVLRFVLRGRVTYLKELISWPFLRAFLLENNETPRIRQWAMNGLQSHLERLEVNRPGFYHRHHGTWLMMRSSARSAVILLAFARIPSAAEILPRGWRDAVEATLEMLYYWKSAASGFDTTILLIRQLLDSS